MASDVLCGRCGAVLGNPSATCWYCAWGPRPVAMAPSRKSPLLAALLGVVPGLGHIYLGRYRRAAGFMAGLGLLQFFDFDLDLTVVGALIGVPLEFGGFGLWLYSIYDAYMTARMMARSG